MKTIPTRARALSRTFLPLLPLLLGGAPGPAQAVEAIVLAVSEGTFGGGSPMQLVDKFRPLADAIGKVLRAPVVISPVSSFTRLEEGMREKRFDLVMARPSDYSARAIRDHGYRYVAQVLPDVQCVFLLPKDSPAKSLADLKDKRVALPDKVSYMGQLCTAELREAGFDIAGKAQYVKEQEVVLYQLKARNVEAGGLSSHAKAVSEKAKGDAGLRELVRGRAQPYFPVIASQKLSPTQVAAVRQELVGLSESPAGRAMLAKVGIQGYDGTGESRMTELLAWLEKK